MTCNLCGAKKHTQNVLSIYRTSDVQEVCGDCAGDLNKLKAACKKLSDKTTATINRRAAKVAKDQLGGDVFWSLLQASTDAIKNVFTEVKAPNGR